MLIDDGTVEDFLDLLKWYYQDEKNRVMLENHIRSLIEQWEEEDDA